MNNLFTLFKDPQDTAHRPRGSWDPSLRISELDKVVDECCSCWSAGSELECYSSVLPSNTTGFESEIIFAQEVSMVPLGVGESLWYLGQVQSAVSVNRWRWAWFTAVLRIRCSQRGEEREPSVTESLLLFLIRPVSDH